MHIDYLSTAAVLRMIALSHPQKSLVQLTHLDAAHLIQCQK